MFRNILGNQNGVVINSVARFISEGMTLRDEILSNTIDDSWCIKYYWYQEKLEIVAASEVVRSTGCIYIFDIFKQVFVKTVLNMTVSWPYIIYNPVNGQRLLADLPINLIDEQYHRNSASRY